MSVMNITAYILKLGINVTCTCGNQDFLVHPLIDISQGIHILQILLSICLQVDRHFRKLPVSNIIVKTAVMKSVVVGMS